MSWLSRFHNTVQPRRLDDDLAEEVRDHIERRTAQLVEQGVSPVEAKRRASLAFGNATQLREASREIRLWSTMEGTLQDLRYALRGLRKNPAFALTAILSLSLAIGANTAIYSIVEASILRPLPVPQPERLFSLSSPDIVQPGADASSARSRETFSYPIYQQFRTAAGDSARLGLFSMVGFVEAQIPDRSAPIENAMRQFVSGDAFELLNLPDEIL